MVVDYFDLRESKDHWRESLKAQQDVFLRPLTKHKFLERAASVARAADLEPLQGHGIQIGATLEYLLRGVPFEVMKSQRKMGK